jgi:hypothetical protein
MVININLFPFLILALMLRFDEQCMNYIKMSLNWRYLHLPETWPNLDWISASFCSAYM